MKRFMIIFTAFLLSFIVAGCGNSAPEGVDTDYDTGIPGSETISETYAETQDTEPAAETFAEAHDTEPVTVDYESVSIDHLVYHVYADHTEIVGITEYNSGGYPDYVIPEGDVHGKPVTKISETLFGNNKYIRLKADSGTDIGRIAREYAVEHSMVFIDTDYGNGNQSYFPDWVYRLDWRERDTSEDIFVAVDDNDRISELVKMYSETGKGYDELLERIMFRHACIADMCWWLESRYRKYEYDSPYGVSYEMTDHDRYDFTENGSNADYTFAVGHIDTYTELEEYAHLLFTDKGAAEYLKNSNMTEVNGQLVQLGGGFGYDDRDYNPAYSIELAEGMIILHEKRELWGYDENRRVEYFTGEYSEHTFIFYNENGGWVRDYDWVRDVYPYSRTAYRRLKYGASVPAADYETAFTDEQKHVVSSFIFYNERRGDGKYLVTVRPDYDSYISYSSIEDALLDEYGYQWDIYFYADKYFGVRYPQILAEVTEKYGADADEDKINAAILEDIKTYSSVSEKLNREPYEKLNQRFIDEYVKNKSDVIEILPFDWGITMYASAEEIALYASNELVRYIY